MSYLVPELMADLGNFDRVQYERHSQFGQLEQVLELVCPWWLIWATLEMVGEEKVRDRWRVRVGGWMLYESRLAVLGGSSQGGRAKKIIWVRDKRAK